MSDPRLKAVYDAASYLFITKGYSNTQVSQIAQAAKIATGTVYNLFAGKKSILHFVLLCNLDKEYLNGEIALPIKEVADEGIIQRLSLIVEELFLKIELKDGKPQQSFIDTLSILFDYTTNHHVAFNIINANRDTLVNIEKKYGSFVDYLYKVIEENFLYFIEQGVIRQVELPQLHLRNIFEGITWWGMYLPYQNPSINVPVQKAKEIALDILKHAYLINQE